MATTKAHDRGRAAERPGQIPLAGWKDVLRRTARQIKDDHVPIVSAGVAFYAFLGLFPALIAVITAYGLVADPDTVEGQVSDVTGAVSPQVKELLEGPLTDAATGDGLTIGLVVSLAAVLWTASGGVKGLVDGINIAYDEPDERGFVTKRGLALLLALGGIVFVVLAVGLIAVVPVVLGVVGLGETGTTIATVLRWPVLAVFGLGAITTMYRLAPDRESPRVRWVLPGAVAAMALWLLVSALFSLYVTNFGNYDETYGALAGVIVLLLWLFLSAFTVLLGAELNAEMEAQTRKDTTVGEPSPMGERDAAKADRLGEARDTV